MTILHKYARRWFLCPAPIPSAAHSPAVRSLPGADGALIPSSRALPRENLFTTRDAIVEGPEAIFFPEPGEGEPPLAS
jgi:hypothetical protein